jgi:hypothetical protein
LECVDGSCHPVNESLHVALQHLRYEARPRYLWADALCINQADWEERAKQVAITAQIFGNASCVLVWLGEAKPRDTLAFALLHASNMIDWITQLESQEGDQADSGVDPLLDFLHEESWCPCCKTRLSNSDLEPDVQSVCSAVNDLSKQPWFSRLWVYQEVASALYVEVYSGFHHLP